MAPQDSTGNRQLRTHDRPSPDGRRPSAAHDRARRRRLDAGVRVGAVVAALARPAAGHLLVGRRRRRPDLAGWATGLTSVGRLTGLVASVLLLAQVLLMARVPVLEHAFGQDRLARLHRLVGFTVVQPDARPHRPDHLGLRRRRPARDARRRSGT